MENIDEREIDAATFCNEVLNVCRSMSFVGQFSQTGLRVVAFLLFTHIVFEKISLPWSLADLRGEKELKKAIDRAHEWLGLVDRHEDVAWFFPQGALDRIWSLMKGGAGDEVLIRRFDYIVKRVGECFPGGSSLSCCVESFVTDFAIGLIGEEELFSESVVDINSLTTGDLGVRFGEFSEQVTCILPTNLGSHAFEVALRLRLYDQNFFFFRDGDDEWLWGMARFAFGFPAVGVAKSPLPVLPAEFPRKIYGLDFAEWFMSTARDSRLAVVVVPTSDLRAKGRRAVVRQRLLSMGCVVGVVDMPVRVSGSVRLSMLIVQSGVMDFGKSCVFMNGRAVDGLRDESLGRLACFLSIPFLRHRASTGFYKVGFAESLGEALSARAHKMFNSKVDQMPGFFRYVPLRDLLSDSSAVLDPSYWIPERQQFVTSDLLDGAPVYRLLSDKKRACCVYVIGNNGAGKSLLLRQLAKAFCVDGRSVRAVASTACDRFESNLKSGADYIYLGARIQPRRLGRKLAELVKVVYESEEKVAIFNQVLDLLSFSGVCYLLSDGSGDDFLKSARVFGSDSIDDSLKGWSLGFRKKDTSSIVSFDHLSSGEQQILLLTARLVANAAESAIFLIDEPEVSLHVSWQRTLPKIFKIISSSFSCQVVVATHSPVLVASAHGESVFRFVAEGGVLDEVNERDSSSVERLLFQGFNTYTSNNREVHERCAELVSRAIEAVNASEGGSEVLAEINDELDRMGERIDKSISVLGVDVTAMHRNLIRKAKIAIAELFQGSMQKERLW